jgi:hypothetical protein
MIKAIKYSLFIIFSVALVSCGDITPRSQQQITPTIYPTSFSPTPKPLATARSTPSVTPTVPSITPSQANNPACTLSTKTNESDGWDCLNQSYGFSIHFPSTAEIARVTPDGGVEVWLQNSPSNPRIDRLLSIGIGQSAEWCFPPEAEKVQNGEHEFVVNNGFEPSGVVYAWKSYAIAKEPKKVCFDFIVGFREWAQDDPPFPPEKDQGLDEVEAILSTFQWLNP